MYALWVMYTGAAVPAEIDYVSQASTLPSRAANIIVKHPGCERVVAYSNDVAIFTVSIAGRGLAG